MRIPSLIIIGLISTAVALPAAHGAYEIEPCIEEINRLVEKEHRIFRSVLFGSKSAEKSNIGTVKYTQDGKPWYKTEIDTWESEKENSETHSDDEINNLSEITEEFGDPERKGIFETKQATTSELLPYVGNSLRAFQCRLANVCETLSLSKTQEGKDPVLLTVETSSCIAVERLSLPMCHINKLGSVSDDVILLHNCEESMRQILDQEAALLKAAVQYDAAYRSLLQIAGNMDMFLEEFSFPVNINLENVTDIVKYFSRLPCFLSSCDASPPPQQ